MSQALERRIEELYNDLNNALEHVGEMAQQANTGEYSDLYDIASGCTDEVSMLRKYADRLEKIGKDADAEGIPIEIAEEEAIARGVKHGW